MQVLWYKRNWKLKTKFTFWYIALAKYKEEIIILFEKIVCIYPNFNTIPGDKSKIIFLITQENTDVTKFYSIFPPSNFFSLLILNVLTNLQASKYLSFFFFSTNIAMFMLWPVKTTCLVYWTIMLNWFDLI